MVRRLLLDRIEATIHSWTVSGDLRSYMNAGMHAHVFSFPDPTNPSADRFFTLRVRYWKRSVLGLVGSGNETMCARC